MRELNQRKSLRSPVDETQQLCELQVGKTRIPANLVNESAGGFSLVVDQSPGVVVRQKAVLHTVNSLVRVRVVHVSEFEPDDATTAAPVGENCARYRIGLRRLGEVEPPSEPSTARDGKGLSSRLANCFRSHTTMVLFGVLLVVVVGVFWSGASAAFQTRGAEFLRQVLRRNNSASHPTTSGADANSAAEEPVQSNDTPGQQTAAEKKHSEAGSGDSRGGN